MQDMEAEDATRRAEITRDKATSILQQAADQARALGDDRLAKAHDSAVAMLASPTQPAETPE